MSTGTEAKINNEETNYDSTIERYEILVIVVVCVVALLLAVIVALAMCFGTKFIKRQREMIASLSMVHQKNEANINVGGVVIGGSKINNKPNAVEQERNVVQSELLLSGGNNDDNIINDGDGMMSNEDIYGAGTDVATKTPNGVNQHSHKGQTQNPNIVNRIESFHEMHSILYYFSYWFDTKS